MSQVLPHTTGPAESLPAIIEFLRAAQTGAPKQFRPGAVLFRQGDPSRKIFAIIRGAVKLSSLSEVGKVHTLIILGPGQLVGLDDCLNAGRYASTAEAIGGVEAYSIDRDEFERLFETNPAFSKAVLREMAHEQHNLATKIQDLVFLDVLQRVKYLLIRLAQQHGHATGYGIRIDINLTHEDIAALVAADRSTTTIHLNELTRLGYLWKESRRFVIPPLAHIEILDHLKDAVVVGDDLEAEKWACKAVEIGVDPVKAMATLTGTMKQVDRGFVRGDLAIADVILSVDATKRALPIIEQELARKRKKAAALGRIVIGTVRGDIHDLGKTVVSTLMTVSGFEVIDLGVNVALADFVKAVEVHRPQVLAISTFLTTTSSEPAEIISTLKAQGLRDRVKILVGGGAMTPELAQQAGGDAYGRTAENAVEMVRKLLGLEAEAG
jgi:methanogenic corrinoid protein MtbC1